jgi:hypothetical protein
MPASNSAWTLHGNVGELHRGRGALSARVDVARPDLGLQQAQVNGRDLPGHLLAIRRRIETSSRAAEPAWPLPLADAYVRGDDLVAAYEPVEDWPYSPQLYWSAAPLEGIDDLLSSLSLLISVETHLLDTWPRISLGSQLACQELLYVDPNAGTIEPIEPDQTIRPSTSACCVLHRLTDSPFSYVEIVPATDFRELAVQQVAGGEFLAEWHLFADFLEKGVIRKARLQSAFLPRESDVRHALACCEEAARSPLPLTT